MHFIRRSAWLEFELRIEKLITKNLTAFYPTINLAGIWTQNEKYRNTVCQCSFLDALSIFPSYCPK